MKGVAFPQVVIIAPLPAISKRTRLKKMVRPIIRSGRKILFLGWERYKGECADRRSEACNVDERVIMCGGGYTSLRVRLMYPFWMISVFFSVLRLGRRRLIIALGWETAFPALLASMLTGSRIVFDDADRFSLVLKLPQPLHSLLERLERWVSFKTYLHIVPGFARYDWRHERMWILRNTPSEEDVRAARTLRPRRPNAAVVLYANGWVGDTRGASIFLRLLELADERKIDLIMIIAGRVDGGSASRLIGNSRVMFLGELSQHEALAWYDVVDAVLTFYDPSVPINRKAESNKWGDALVFGCKVIVNSEVDTAKELIDAGLAVSVPYHDAEALADMVAGMEAGSDMNVKRSVCSQRRTPEFCQQFNCIVKYITDIG